MSSEENIVNIAEAGWKYKRQQKTSKRKLWAQKA